MNQTYKNNLINTLIIVGSIALLFGFFDFLLSGISIFTEFNFTDISLNNMLNVLAAVAFSLMGLFLIIIVLELSNLKAKDKIKKRIDIAITALLFVVTVAIIAFIVVLFVVIRPEGTGADAAAVTALKSGLAANLLVYLVTSIVMGCCYVLKVRKVSEPEDEKISRGKDLPAKAKSQPVQGVKESKSKNMMNKILGTGFVACSAIFLLSGILFTCFVTTSTYFKSETGFYYDSYVTSIGDTYVKICREDGEQFLDIQLKINYIKEFNGQNVEDVIIKKLTFYQDDIRENIYIGNNIINFQILSCEILKGNDYISLPTYEESHYSFGTKEKVLLSISVVAFVGAGICGVIYMLKRRGKAEEGVLQQKG